MKKSKKPEITPEQILGDYNKIMEFVNKLEGQDLTNINLKELEDQTEQIKKEIEDKYNPIIDKLNKNLDSKK
jgi:hemerythrin-like domain-containing protein